MSRLAALEKLKTHPFYSADFKKLTKGELAELELFIRLRENKTRDEYAYDANRWVLGQKGNKNMGRMADILTAVNGQNNEK